MGHFPSWVGTRDLIPHSRRPDSSSRMSRPWPSVRQRVGRPAAGPKLEAAADHTSSTDRRSSAWLVRMFAGATNLLAASRTFSIHGSGSDDRALIDLLTRIGARKVEIGQADYLFCTSDVA